MGAAVLAAECCRCCRCCRCRAESLEAGPRPHLDLALQVGQADARDGRELLGRVLGKLRRLQPARRVDDALQLVRAHLGLRLGQHLLLLLLELVGQRRVGLHLDGGQVAVLHEARAQQVLEDALARVELRLGRARRDRGEAEEVGGGAGGGGAVAARSGP